MYNNPSINLSHHLIESFKKQLCENEYEDQIQTTLFLPNTNL